ncbi:hypothetical protein HQ533_04685 [Candidatus Woesearchaeota archaeon]|nr:hypothetical protein [Candidatus Woesearchaeota archaeon]
MTFIKINNKIQDYRKHKREIFLTKNHIIISIYDILVPHGFEKHGKNFINKDLNLKLDLKFEKLEEEVFV